MTQSILIVDDQRANLVALEATLAEIDVEIISATSGQEALAILLRKNVAMVLLDVQMPGMDGFEVANLMRQRSKTRHIPIIFLTAINKEDRHLFRGYESGGVDFIFKPFDPFVLISKVKIFLELDWRQQQLQDALRRLDQLKTSNEILLKSVGEGIIGVNAEGNITFLNPAAEEILGTPTTDMIGTFVYDSIIVSTQQNETVDWRESRIYKSCVGGTTYHTDVGVFRLAGGRVIPVEYTASPIQSPRAGFEGVVIVFKDITERKRAEERLHYMAQYDALTGLGNRNLFTAALNNAITYSRHSGQVFALLFMDLDRFKQVNDTLGHDAGDLLLKEVAERIRHCIRDMDILCRLGGDEFTIIITGKSAEQASTRVSENLLRELSRPFDIFGHETYVGGSIGIVYFPAMGEDSAELIKHADMAMYQAKHEGRNRYRVFDPNMRTVVEKAMVMEVELRRAVDGMDFFVYYQPKFDIATRTIIGVEALIRWKMGERMISPAAFIPIAEETGLIHLIGRWVFETVATHVARWSKKYCLPDGFRASVNMSVQQLNDPEIVNMLRHTMTERGVDPDWLEIEITEGMFFERTEDNMARLHDIREAGLGIALDDFGTGYSSLSYLAKLPLTVLKIDKAFVDDIERPQGSAIISAVVALARGLHMDVVAEGVETESQAQQLLQLGCPWAQGYHYSKPLDLPNIEALIEKHCGWR